MFDNDGRKLKTTRTSLRILELALEYEEVTLAELDRMIDKPKSSLHSHLNTLVDCRYLVKDGDVYTTSFRFALLGERARRQNRLAPGATRTIDQLAATTGEEVNVTVLEYGRLLMVYGSSDSETSEDGSFRREYDLHNTAAGKAVLAELKRDRVDRILDKWGMPRETESTITDRERLYECLDEITEQGYAVVNEEFAPGLVAVGATVHGPDGELIGGLSVGGPKYRIEMDRLHGDLAEQLLSTVASLESETNVLA